MRSEYSAGSTNNLVLTICLALEALCGVGLVVKLACWADVTLKRCIVPDIAHLAHAVCDMRAVVQESEGVCRTLQAPAVPGSRLVEIGRTRNAAGLSIFPPPCFEACCADPVTTAVSCAHVLWPANTGDDACRALWRRRVCRARSAHLASKLLLVRVLCASLAICSLHCTVPPPPIASKTETRIRIV